MLYGFLAADGDAGNKKGVKDPGYGKLRLLELPDGHPGPGPGQVQNTFNSDPTVSQQLNVLRLGQSDVINGNLLTLPVGGGLLYVQPVYVKSTGETSYPMLQQVLVAFGDKIAFADTLDDALDQLFGGNSGASAGDSPNIGNSRRRRQLRGDRRHGRTPERTRTRRPSCQGPVRCRPGHQGRPGGPGQGRLRRATAPPSRGSAMPSPRP